MSLFDHIEDKDLREQSQAAHDSAMTEMKDSVKSSLQEDIKSAVEEATKGLKGKNAELLDEKKKIQSTLKNFDDLDAEKAREALKFLDENEDAKLIKDGKIEELIDRRTSIMKSDFEAKTTELSDKLVTAAEHGLKFEDLYNRKMIDDSLRSTAMKLKVRPEALSDILLRGQSIFNLGDDGTVEARDTKGSLVKTEDSKVLTPLLWLEGLKKEAPHYWPSSKGAGATGKFGTGEDLDEALTKAASSGDMKEYRRLRSIKTKENA